MLSAETEQPGQSGNYRAIIPQLVEAAKNDPGLLKREAIESARRKLPLPELMFAVGDADYVSSMWIDSPFHPGVKGTFKVYSEGRKRKRWFFYCCDVCGRRSDEVDYLRLRFQMSTAQALRVLCALAKIVSKCGNRAKGPSQKEGSSL